MKQLANSLVSIVAKATKGRINLLSNPLIKTAFQVLTLKSRARGCTKNTEGLSLAVVQCMNDYLMKPLATIDGQDLLHMVHWTVHLFGALQARNSVEIL